MIIPISRILGASMALRNRGTDCVDSTGRYPFSLSGVFPWFILGFIATSLVNTLHLLPAFLLHDAAESGKFLIVVMLEIRL